MCGVYLQTGRILVLASFIPIAMVLNQTKGLLHYLEQKPYICEYTQYYVLANIPGLLFIGIYDLERRFLT